MSLVSQAKPFLEGYCQLAISMLAADVASDLKTQIILEEKINTCIGRQDHPLLQHKLTPKKFAKTKHITVHYQDPLPTLIDQTLQQAGCQRNTIINVPDLLPAVFSLIESDLLIVLPERLAKHLCQYLPLTYQHLPFTAPTMTLYQVWHQKDYNNPTLTWLTTTIASILKD